MTCNDTNTNISIMEALDCKLLRLPLEKIQVYFSHPNDKDRVYFTSDACHMLKLARKIMSHCKQLLSEKGIIRWQYIRELYYWQSAIGLKFVNKLNKTHIQWGKNPMKVHFAAQTLSSSVTNAIEALRPRHNERNKAQGIEHRNFLGP